MSEKKKNFMKAIFFLFIAICFAAMIFTQVAPPNKKYPYIGIILSLFLAIAYLRRVFVK